MGISLSRRSISSAVTVALATCAVAAMASPALAAGAASDGGTAGRSGGGGRPTVVLVHGAFADASGWNDVAASLMDDGYPVVAPPNELRGLRNDAANVASVLKNIKGPIVLAGHSYGGAVISQAAAGNPNVRALVFVSAFAPDVGESAAELSTRFAGSDLPAAINRVPFTGRDTSGTDLYIKGDRFRSVFAGDLPESRTRLMAAEQRPVSDDGFAEKATAAAWRDIPSWFVVSRQDRAIAPDLERFEAKRAKSRTVEIDSSHVSMMSHPDVVARQIREAAGATDDGRGSGSGRGGSGSGSDGRGGGSSGRGGGAPAELAATGSHGQAVAAVGAVGAAALLSGSVLTRFARRRDAR
ncbi:alpha/beta fold hydrolase [Kitasatospora brasiliensis]|uniref:alpha/beta fold hydrolase n=1 Tax=Kitasatospora brasiliensis TaxID=3058040 RepID=UPI00292DFBAB|nr:alpha/beta hydrolase [Kitasatospora sp. K002]